MFQSIKREVAYFRKLNDAAQKLLISSAVYDVAQPLLFVFINAFIWRSTNNLMSVGLYNLGFFITIPLCFMLNGWLLKKLHISFIFITGLVGQGLVTGLVFFFPSNNIVQLLFLGALQGVPIGLYWANRNFITIATTSNQERTYYTALETSVETLANILVPIIFGWTLVLGDFFHLYSIQQAYRGLILFVTLLLFWAGWIFRDAQIENPVIKRIFVAQRSKKWKKSLSMEFCRGFVDRMGQFLPSLIVITLLGNEGTLGTIQSIAGLLNVIVLYFLGRKAGVHHRLTILKYSVMLFAGVSLLLNVWLSVFSIIVFLTGIALTEGLEWISVNPIQMEVIESEENGNSTNNYAYVVEREVSLNIGRVVAMCAFFALIQASSQSTALRLITLVVAASQIALFWLARV